MTGNEEPIIEELSIHEIIFGKGDYAGLFELMEERISERIKMNGPMVDLLESLKGLLQSLTTGKKITLAQYMRNYVMKHP